MRPIEGGFELQGELEVAAMQAALKITGRHDEARAMVNTMVTSDTKLDQAHPHIKVMEDYYASLDDLSRLLIGSGDVRFNQAFMDSMAGITYETTATIPTELVSELGFSALSRLAELGDVAEGMLTSLAPPQKTRRSGLLKLLSRAA